MQTTILQPTQTQTSETKIICETFTGKWFLWCVKYTGSPVQVQVKEPGGTEWKDCVFAGKPIELTEGGAGVDVPITPCYHYRCITAEAGAEVLAFSE